MMQIYYAHYERGSLDIDSALNELSKSIGSSLDLYFTLINLLFAFRDIEEERINISQNKHLPTEEDKNPNTVYLDNHILKLMETNKQIAYYRSNNSFNWNENIDVLKKYWLELRSSDYFVKYFSQNDSGVESAKSILFYILEECIAYNLEIEQTLEDMNIYWNDDLEFVISIVKRFVDSLDEDRDIINYRVSAYQNKEDEEFAKTILRNAMIHNSKYDAIIQKHTTNWDLDRIALIDRLMLHIALAEFFSMPDIPARVTINEFVEISKFYSTEKSSMFMNGILEKMYKDQKQEGNIVKTGRGLVGDI
ncbi:MAG: transcription antitermination factor NusB [Bacteroidales bacterium]|nr:transcription antitermination factor NusB [Bacteroidales bacterium]